MGVRDISRNARLDWASTTPLSILGMCLHPSWALPGIPFQ
jgi:hypothetical protein